jgi:hypothetical protein
VVRGGRKMRVAPGAGVLQLVGQQALLRLMLGRCQTCVSNDSVPAFLVRSATLATTDLAMSMLFKGVLLSCDTAA